MRPRGDPEHAVFLAFPAEREADHVAGERVTQRRPVAARRRGDLDRRFARCLEPRRLPGFESASTTAQPCCARDSGDDDADRRKQGATSGIEVVVMVIVSKQDGSIGGSSDAAIAGLPA
jgi:hypothetical protein